MIDVLTLKGKNMILLNHDKTHFLKYAADYFKEKNYFKRALNIIGAHPKT